MLGIGIRLAKQTTKCISALSRHCSFKAILGKFSKLESQLKPLEKDTFELSSAAKNCTKKSEPYVSNSILLKSQTSKSVQSKSEIMTFFQELYKFDDELADKRISRIFARHDFTQYGTSGLPLKYKRENFIEDIKNVLKDLPQDKQEEILKDFNLKYGYGDIDGIAHKAKGENLSKIHKKINSLIDEFYSNNECLIADVETKKLVDTLIKGFPEFNMIVGKVQHDTHAYSVDVHTIEVLKKCFEHPNFKLLSDESKEVLYLSTLMHDFGKVGNLRHPGHALVSKMEAEKILQAMKLPEQIKERVLNQIKNHHWFEGYNTGTISKEQLLELFKTNEDLKIAKIMAKSDLESVNKSFHKSVMNVLSQEEFDTKFFKRIADIPSHEYQDVIDSMLLQRKGAKCIKDGKKVWTANELAEHIKEDYFEANPAIRKFCLKDVGHVYCSEESVLECLSIYDTIINQCSIPRNITLYRGGSGADFGYSGMLSKEFLDTFFKKGKVFRFPCYSETSLDEQVGTWFGRQKAFWGQGILFKINVPKGTKGLYLGHTALGCKFDPEEEILLQRGLIGKFKSRKQINGMEVVEIDIVKQPLFKKVHEFWKDLKVQEKYRKTNY